MEKLTLKFESSLERCELVETGFYHPMLCAPLRCVRGKAAGAFKNAGTFQWTRAVHALSLLLIRVKLNAPPICSPRETVPHTEMPELVGYRGSLAASLDAAISKEPRWLNDMFGTDSRGNCLINRLLSRTNSGLKRPGPVALAFNEKFLEIDQVWCEDYSGAQLSHAELQNIAAILCIDDCGSLSRGTLNEVDPESLAVRRRVA